VDEAKLDVVVGGAQKCLGGPPGMTLMSVSDAAWERARANPNAPRASYLSMLDWKEKWIDGDRFPFTPSVSEIYGVEACVDELLEEGLENAIARHERIAAACRAGVRAMGLEVWAARDEVAGSCATAITLPEGLTDAQVTKHCREKYGVMLSGSYGAGNLVRIGHMGLSARSLHPVVGLSALGRTFADLGVSVEIGAGVEAALAEIAQAEPAVA
jgi:pyridoxamine--pyruvate transaminase